MQGAVYLAIILQARLMPHLKGVARSRMLSGDNPRSRCQGGQGPAYLEQLDSYERAAAGSAFEPRQRLDKPLSGIR